MGQGGSIPRTLVRGRRLSRIRLGDRHGPPFLRVLRRGRPVQGATLELAQKQSALRDPQHLKIKQRRQQAAPGQGSPTFSKLRDVQMSLLGSADQNVAHAQVADRARVGQALLARATYSGQPETRRL